MLLKRVFGTFLALAVTVGAGATVDDSLAGLFDGQSITVGDKVFDNWQLITNGVNGNAVSDLSKVHVTGLDDDPLDPGLKYTVDGLNLGVDFVGEGSVNLDFSFRVRTADGSVRIKDNSLLLNGFGFDAGPNAFIEIHEFVFEIPSGDQLAEKLVSADVDSHVGDSSLFDERPFAPQSEINVLTRIVISGEDLNNGVFLTMFEQRFSQLAAVPAPAALPAGLALLGMLGLKRRRRRA